jgi:HEAT repeat protein
MLSVIVLWALQSDVSRLIDKLSSADPNEAEQARHDLIDFADDAVGPLKAFVEKNPEGRASEHAKLALKSIQVRKSLTDRIYLSYPYVEENIAASGRDALSALLQKMLKDQEKNSLTSEDYDCVVQLLMEREPLGDDAKRTILKAIQNHRLKESARKALPLIADPDSEIAEMAAYSVVQVGSDAMGPDVVKLLSDASAEVRARAIIVLGHMRYSKGAEAIEKLLEDSSPKVRRRAVSALAAMGIRSAAAAIAGRLADDDAEVRETAAAAIVELGAKDALPAIAKMIDKSRPPEARALGLKLLAHLNDPEAIPHLMPLLEDDSKEIRGQAVLALGRLKADAAAPKLVGLLKSELRDEAARALSNIQAESAIPDLVEMVRSADEPVRTASQEILKKYRGQVLAKAVEGAPLARARDLSLILGSTRQEDARRELLDRVAKDKDPHRALSLLALGETAEPSAKAYVLELAKGDGEWRFEALLVMNAYSNRSLYSDVLRPGFRKWELKGGLEKAIDDIGAATGQRFLVSDRVPKETRDASVEIAEVLSPREILVRLSREHKIGFIFEREMIRVVPLGEAVDHWQ